MAVDPFECYRGKVRAGTVPQYMLDEVESLRDTLLRNEADVDQIAQAQRVFEQLERRVELREIQTALQFLKFQDVAKRMQQARPRRSFIFNRRVGGAEAMTSMLVPDNRGVYRGANVEHQSHTILGQAHALFGEGLLRLRRKGTGLIDSAETKALEREVMHALYGDRSVSKAARDIADAWMETDHFLIGELRRGGADIVERRNWRIPRRHEKLEFRRASSKPGAVFEDHLAEWKSFIRPLLDRPAMISRATGKPMDDVELDELLDDMFENVYYDGMNHQADAVVGRPGRKRPRRLADRHTMERVIEFKGADEEMAYNERFGGNHDLFSVFTGHMEKRSREAAFLQIMGPDPEATLDLMMKQARAFDDAEPASTHGFYRELSGKLDTPDSDAMAGGFRGVRNVLTSAQLGGAMLSATADVNFQALTAAYNGLDGSKVLTESMSNWLRGAYTTEDTEFALRLGLVAEEWSGSALAAARVGGEMNGPRVTRKMSDAVMRASFLSSWTQANRHAFQVEFLGHLAQMKDLPFDQIQPATRRALEARNFTSKDWDAIRAVPTTSRTESGTGPQYMNAAEMFRAGQRDPAMKLMQTIQEEVEFAVPSANARTRAYLKGVIGGGTGLQAGTFAGEMMRTGAMYKSFSVTVANTHLSRYLLNDMALRNKVGYMGAMVIGTSIMGGFAMNAKQIAAGKDPIDPFGENAGKFWPAALVQGGGLGLMGDFLFQDHSRFGKGVTMSLAGPGASLLDDAKNLAYSGATAPFDEDSTFGRNLVDVARDYTPGGNLWYSRAAFERTIIDQLQHLADPDASDSFRSKASRAKRNFGAGYWWAPGRVTPDRAPQAPESFQEAAENL